MYAKIENDQIVKYPISNIHQELPNISFPEDMTNVHLPEGYVKVHYTPSPAYNPDTHKVKPSDPVFNGEVWEQGYTVEPLSMAELETRLLAFKADAIDKTQRKLDTFAKTRGYDNILSACSYATSTIAKFQKEGQYCVEARDATWTKLYEILAGIEAGQPIPTFIDIEQQLPVLQWIE